MSGSGAVAPPPAGAVAERARRSIADALRRNIPGVETPPALELEIGRTPRDLVFTQDTLKLYRYRPQQDEVYRVPLLLVMSLVNRPYIFDLAPGQSLIEYLLRRGYDVYMIDWGSPRPEHRTLTLDDYVLDYLPTCVERVREGSGEPDVTLVGYCLGGTLAAMYAALFPDEGLRNLVCFTTPVNAEGMPLIRAWTNPDHFDVDRLVDELGNVPPDLISNAFQMLRPLQRTAARLRVFDHLGEDEFTKAFLRFDRWAMDQVPIAGECFRQLVKDFLQRNRLARGDLALRGRKVDLANIRAPLLHATGKHDHLVPEAAARDLVRLAGSREKEDLVLKGGHVSLVAGGNAVHRLWPALDRWLGRRSV